MVSQPADEVDPWPAAGDRSSLGVIDAAVHRGTRVPEVIDAADESGEAQAA
jgi:hypothetical protein